MADCHSPLVHVTRRLSRPQLVAQIEQHRAVAQLNCLALSEPFERHRNCPITAGRGLVARAVVVARPHCCALTSQDRATVASCSTHDYPSSMCTGWSVPTENNPLAGAEQRTIKCAQTHECVHTPCCRLVGGDPLPRLPSARRTPACGIDPAKQQPAACVNSRVRVPGGEMRRRVIGWGCHESQLPPGSAIVSAFLHGNIVATWWFTIFTAPHATFCKSEHRSTR